MPTGKAILSKVVGGMLAVVLLTFGTFLLLGSGASSSCACSYAGFLTAEDLVQESQLIVVVQYVGERKVKVEIPPNPVSGMGGGSRNETVRTFRVGEVLKGEELATIDVWGGPRGSEQYVLFLLPHPHGNKTAWRLAGAPEHAVLRGEQLLFQSNLEIYKRDALRRGNLPIAGSVAPFALTLNELRTLAQLAPATSP
jgi:hypothetical protein